MKRGVGNMLCLIGLFFGGNLCAQMTSSLRCRQFVKANFIQLEEKDVIAWSTLDMDPSTALIIDSINQRIEFVDSEDLKGDSIKVCYRVIPLSYFSNYHSDLEIYKDEYEPDIGADLVKKPSQAIGEQLFAKDDISKSGSLSRGVSFGNRQNLVVNSSLNLQLDGKISDNLSVLANITDQNIPYQPEGNTQNIQELDNVFIKLYNKRFAFTAGDIVFRNNHSHYLRYLKNVQGGQVDYKDKIKGVAYETNFGGSIAKGKFASVTISPIDGVQGPYQIKIPQVNGFTLIIANSEKVFLDGKQLTRGFDKDYTIDYNLSEIIFTPGILITGFSRIRVDVEYSDQNYSRDIIGFSQTVQSRTLNAGIRFYQERDNQRRPLNFELSQSDLSKLATAGDNTSLAAISTIDSTDFDPGRVMYQKKDTLVEGVIYDILSFSIDSEVSTFVASFSEVGFQNGDYVRQEGIANGQIYRWVAPVDGISQGNFAPILIVPTATSKQMVVLELQKEFKEKHRFKTELALSNADRNLFSSIDDDDNTGQALMLDYQYNDKIGKVLGYNQFFAGTHYELLTKNFTAIDRFRNVDFDRVWGLSTASVLSLSRDDVITGAFGIRGQRNDELSYSLTARSRGEDVQGLKHRIRMQQTGTRLQFNGEAIQSNNETVFNVVNWKRVYSDLSYHHPLFTPGYTFELDQTNRFSASAKDSVINTPLHFYQHSVYVEQGDSASTSIRLEHTLRYDRQASEGVMQDTTVSNVTSLNLNKVTARGNVSAIFSYRSISDAQVDTTISKNLMSTIGMRQSFWNGVLNLSFNYSALQSRELQREFAFVQVNSGEGTHTWRDENADDAQSLDEFYEALNFDERNYIKVFLPTNDYILAYGNLLNATIAVRPRSASVTKCFMGSFLNKLSSITAVTVDQKDNKDGFLERLNPFSNKLSDVNTIAAKRQYKSTLFYNQRSPVFGMDIGLFSSDRKTLLVNGDEWLGRKEITGNQRLRLARNYTLFAKYKQSTQRSDSEFLEDRNYLVRGNLYEFKLQWQPSNFFRISSIYSNNVKRSIVSDNNDQSSATELGMETRWNRGGKQTISANFSYKDIAFNGVENTALSYVLLEALRPGVNTLWNVNLQMKLINGLQLSISYNGRKSEGAKPVNIGQMRVTALF